MRQKTIVTIIKDISTGHIIGKNSITNGSPSDSRKEEKAMINDHVEEEDHEK